MRCTDTHDQHEEWVCDDLFIRTCSTIGQLDMKMTTYTLQCDYNVQQSQFNYRVLYAELLLEAAVARTGIAKRDAPMAAQNIQRALP